MTALRPAAPVPPATRTLSLPGVELVVDVRGPLPTADGRPPLLLVGQPMDSGGFAELADRLPDRTVVTIDPRGIGRSRRSDGRTDSDPTVQAEDLHQVVEALGAGPVEVFGSSGGAITALVLVATHPRDVVTLVAHEPPLTSVLRDADAAQRAIDAVRDSYRARGWGAGMAAFLAMSSWQGEFTDEYFARPAPDPAAFGLPTGDDGSRDDLLLSDRANAVGAHRPDVAALTAAPTRIVVAVGQESGASFTGRTSAALAELLGRPLVVFPSHHGGFHTLQPGHPGQPDAFARRLQEVLESPAGTPVRT
jgi:pimeloyl-ACP methyl ester carboxylesterase